MLSLALTIGPESIIKYPAITDPTTCSVSHTNSTIKTKKTMAAAVNPTSLATAMIPLYRTAIKTVT